MGDLLHILGAALERGSLALILALSLAAIWLAPVLSSADAVRRWRLLMVLLVVTAVATGIDLILRSAALADVPPGEAWGFVPRVLGHSDYGYFWLWRAGVWGLMLAAALWLWRGWRALPSLLLFVAALATLSLISVTGHAGEDGLLTLPNLINWLHLVGITLWGGPVILYALLVLPELRRQGWPAQTATVATRLSTLATGALALVLLSGVYNSWRQLGRLSDLWTTDYGWLLLLKLGLVALMMIVGALNRFRMVPRIAAVHGDAASASHSFLKILLFDSVVFISVLVVAVILGMQMPPSHS